MSSGWRVDQHYGFGAGNVPLVAHLHRHPIRPDGLLRGLRRAAIEAHDEDKSLRRKLVWVTLSIFAAFVSVNTLLEILNPTEDISNIEIVMFEDLPLPPEIEIEIPEATIEPPPPPAPVVPPPQQRIAKQPVAPPLRIQPLEPPLAAPTPPEKRERRIPEPVMAVPRPKRAAPKIQVAAMRDIALPSDAPRHERARLTEVEKPRERTRVDMQPVAAIQRSEPQTTPQPRRTYTRPLPQAQRAHEPLPLPVMTPSPALRDQPAPTRQPQRFAMVTKRSNSPRPAIERAPAMPIAVPDEPAAPAVRSPLRSAPKARSAAPPQAAAPHFSAALPLPDEPARRSVPKRTSTAPPAARSHSSVDQRDLAMPTRSQANQRDASALEDASRSERSVPVAAPGSQRLNPSLAGVALGSLSACLSDREEDSLKRRLVAAVTTQSECVSSAGTYRFIEMKNLNAFSMWIDRAPSRTVGDRCVELNHALDCLAQTRAKEPGRR